MKIIKKINKLDNSIDKHKRRQNTLIMQELHSPGLE